MSNIDCATGALLGPQPLLQKGSIKVYFPVMKLSHKSARLVMQVLQRKKGLGCSIHTHQHLFFSWCGVWPFEYPRLLFQSSKFKIFSELGYDSSFNKGRIYSSSFNQYLPHSRKKASWIFSVRNSPKEAFSANLDRPGRKVAQLPIFFG